MESSATIIGSGEIVHDKPLEPPSKCKTYGFALTIIVGIGVLAVGGAGVAGYFHVGALSNLSQVNAIIMMAAGGGGGVTVLIIGIVGSVKNRQKDDHQRSFEKKEQIDFTPRPQPVKVEEIKVPIEAQEGLIYGVDAWKIWEVEVLDVVPKAPEINWDAKDPFFEEAYKENYVLLYIPERIRVNEEEKSLTFEAFSEICKDSIVPNMVVKNLFGENTASGWVLASKAVIPDSCEKTYEFLVTVSQEDGFRMPYMMEATVLNLMVNATTGERLYGKNPSRYTYCLDVIGGVNPVIVGGFDSKGLVIRTTHKGGASICGTGAFKKF